MASSSSSSSAACLPCDRDRGALNRRRTLVATIGVGRCCARFGIGLGRRRNERGLVLAADVAPLDLQAALAIDADEGAGMDDLGGLEDVRPVREGFERFLEFAETRIHLVRQFVGVFIFRLKRVVFGLEGIEARLLLGGQISRCSLEPAVPVIMAVGKAGGDIEPLPAFGGDRLGFRPQLVGDKTFEQSDILEPAAAILFEEIAQHVAAGRLIGCEADKPRALVGSPHRALGQKAPDLVRLVVARLVDALPDLFLSSMLGGDGERHQLLERHAVVGIDVEQSRGDGREPEPLLHHVDGDEEDGRDIFLGTTLLAQGLKCPKLIEGMKRDAMHVFGERVFFRGDLASASLTMHGTGAVFARRFCFTRSSSAR